jgi:hypothetical protein
MKLTERKLQNIIREEIRKLNERYEGYVRDRNYRTLSDELEKRLGDDVVGMGRDSRKPIVFRVTTKRYWEVKVSDEYVEDVRRIADELGIRINLKKPDPPSGPRY